jgi:hypothetical protein
VAGLGSRNHVGVRCSRTINGLQFAEANSVTWGTHIAGLGKPQRKLFRFTLILPVDRPGLIGGRHHGLAFLTNNS